MMGSWKINPRGVQRILVQVSEDQQDLTKAVTGRKIEAVVDGPPWVPMITDCIQVALNELIEDQEVDLQNIGNRIDAGLAGVSNAVIAYNHGQLRMAETFQDEGIKAATSGDFRYFAEHGYAG